jgi:hypothetical protein
MKVTSSKPVGQRMFKSVKATHTTHRKIKVKMKRPLWIEPIGKNWWFDLNTGEWVQGYNGKGGMTTSYYSMESDGFNNIYSLKAAKRKIANWDVPKGTWFRVSLPYVGYDFKIRKN